MAVPKLAKHAAGVADAAAGSILGTSLEDEAVTHAKVDHDGDFVVNTITGKNVMSSTVIDFAAGHADYTMSAAEANADLLLLASADQAANVIVPSANKMYIVRNASGAAITLKKAAGTGIAVANGKTAVLMYSVAVADIIRVTADATHSA